MRILVVCDEGNNRSVTIAHQLKYWNHDVLSCGLTRNGPETLEMLFNWAERIILVEKMHIAKMPTLIADNFAGKMQLWDVGPDTYPRPFNPELLQKVRRLMQEHEAEYKS